MQKRMKWATGEFDWNRARAFLATAEEGSYSAAARALSLTQPTVGRQVAALEEELEVILFERVGNVLELTDAGLELLEHVRGMNAAAQRLVLAATGQSTAIEGTVSIAASEAVSAYLLPPIVAALRGEHPAIEIDLVASNTTSDLLRREADIAVRNYRPTDPDLFATKVRESRAWLYATPAYLDSLADTSTPEALSKDLRIIGFDNAQQFIDLFVRHGYQLTPDSFPVRTTNHLVQWALCKQGVGACAMMEEVGDAEPGVVKILPDADPPMVFPTWLTCHRELKTSRRIRVVFDALAAALSQA